MTSLMNETVPWGVIHDGLTDLTLLATAIAMGAPLVRVGFEDSIFWTPDQSAKGIAELVQKLTPRVRLLGHAVATPPEARTILGIRRI
jgi:3-keto-5-aminohexanoate cleavage enzyme